MKVLPYGFHLASTAASVSARALFALLIICLSGALPATADDGPQPTLPTIDVLVGDVPLLVEVASSSQQRYLGLSFRPSLDEAAGMLFVYSGDRPLTFTMRNTLVPLSIAYIDASLTIIEIIDMDVGPGQLFPSSRPARFALEVNQGWFERNDIEAGAKLTMP